MRYFIYCRKSSEGEERQVLSLASQQEALAKAFAEKPEIEIVGIYEEAKSAKTPGRPQFAQMLTRIEAGEADGIAAWAPDRLARNSIDGGHVIYLLDRGVLRDLKFATYTFENNSQGKFMLSIMFGQSKYYSDALSENVKRGNATKVAMGWRPNRPPLGYLNCPTTRTIIPDPTLFPLVRRIFELFLSEAYTPRQISRIVTEDWGFLTPVSRRSGGKPIARSTLYRMLSNPFYAGLIDWAGARHEGRHKPIITQSEYRKVQTLLDRRGTPRTTTHEFAYSGLISCGACGHAVTAERKINRHGSRYVYYHCAARSWTSGACAERSVEQATLDIWFTAFLRSIAMTPTAATWTRRRLAALQSKEQVDATTIAETRSASLAEIASQLVELTSLRLRRLVEDAEFVEERKRLEARRGALENAPRPASTAMMFELLDVAERVSIQAADWFATAESAGKRRLLKTLCSNPRLIDRKLLFEAAKPFVIRSDLADIPNQRGVMNDLRTQKDVAEALFANLHELAGQNRIDATLAELKGLLLLFEDRDR